MYNYVWGEKTLKYSVKSFLKTSDSTEEVLRRLLLSTKDMTSWEHEERKETGRSTCVLSIHAHLCLPVYFVTLNVPVASICCMYRKMCYDPQIKDS
jgi:hypothetical protein